MAPAGHLCPALRCGRQCRRQRDPRQHHDRNGDQSSCRGRALGRRLRRDLAVVGQDGLHTTSTAARLQRRDHAPELAHPVSDQSQPEDQAWSFQVPANTFSDLDGDTLTYSASLGDGSLCLAGPSDGLRASSWRIRVS